MTSEQRSEEQEAGTPACVGGGREGAHGVRGAGGVSDEGAHSGVQALGPGPACTGLSSGSGGSH